MIGTAVYSRKFDEVFNDDGLFIRERDNIIMDYQKNYECIKETCGEKSEEAQEARSELKQILSGSILDSKKMVIEYFNFVLECVCDNPEYYLVSDKEMIRMIKLFSPRYQTMAYLQKAEKEERI